jgi:hypothetical protein
VSSLKAIFVRVYITTNNFVCGLANKIRKINIKVFISDIKDNIVAWYCDRIAKHQTHPDVGFFNEKEWGYIAIAFIIAIVYLIIKI